MSIRFFYLHLEKIQYDNPSSSKIAKIARGKKREETPAIPFKLGIEVK